MHRLRTVPGGWNPGEEGVIDIDQSPGDIIFLSAGDTELSCWVNAYKKLQAGEKKQPLPTLRAVNLGALKQELTIDNYVDDVIAHSKLVVARLLGGISYYAYLVEQIRDICLDHAIPLYLLPGYNEADPGLIESSHLIDPKRYQSVWNCFNLGGIGNLQTAFVELTNTHFETTIPVPKTESIPDCFCYQPGKGIVEYVQEDLADTMGTIGVIAYRAHYLADNLAAIDALHEALSNRSLRPVIVLVHTLRNEASINEVMDKLTHGGRQPIDGVINTTSFSTKSIQDSATQSGFARLEVPVFQGMIASCTRETWEGGDFGLPPTDIAMNVALPEVDGRIITRPISFKAPFQRDDLTESDLTRYEPHTEGIVFVADLAKTYAKLRHCSNDRKKIALILPNYPNKDARLANGVGLDTPLSVLRILHSMRDCNYDLGHEIPADSSKLMDRLLGNVTNDQDTLALKHCEVFLDETLFCEWRSTLSPALQQKIRERWGDPENDPYFIDGKWSLSGFLSGNVWVAIQPSRGFNLSLAESYHSPDLPPPWNYLAFYCYLSRSFEADAVVHVGKHGNLEWLPGKSLALSESSCFPAALFPAIPHFYPFMVNDPGEGTQAKRRNQAVIIDHLIPPLTRAETYGPLIELEQKIDEYYECSDLDPDRALLLNNDILKLVEDTRIRVDLGTESTDLDELLVALDGYLCEIKEAQIRDGLHILGTIPGGEQLIDTLIALHRLPSADKPGITQALARDKGLEIDPVNDPLEKPLKKKQATIPGARIVGDVVESLENEVKHDLVSYLETGTLPHNKPELAKVLERIVSDTLPRLEQSKNEIQALLKGLDGRFIDSGPSGAPTRGRLDVLPTGRNFYSVDLRSIPTRSAWELGKRSAERVVQRYIQEKGEYPRAISLSVWGTSTMRTGGDDITQAMALMGVRPIWQGMSQRIVDFEVLSLIELGRPRVDVTLRISGFFRDAFPGLISLFNAAVKKVVEEDEPEADNPLRHAYLNESKHWQKKGLSQSQSEKHALFRVFGSKPGSYGAGLQELISNRNWKHREDLAESYLQWGCFAYTNHAEHSMVPDVFKQRLIQTQVVLQNQDNREHDILDSDDYYQFHGGMANAAEVFSGGESKEIYFGDHSRPENPRIKTLKEELLKVYRSRVINPKWIRGVQRHGYKGAFEMAATVDYLFGYDSTTDLIDDFVYEEVTQTYLFNHENQQFLKDNNPWALKDMAERMLEAIERNMWKAPKTTTLASLKALILESEGMVEDRLGDSGK